MSLFRNRRSSAWLGLTALLATVFTLALAATPQAQVVSDPRVAEFSPSPDHWDVLDSGQPAVLRYELGMYMIGASAPFATIDVGKPSPDADGKIRYDFASGVAGWPVSGGTFEARVSAVGPEGAALSEPSNPFTFTTSSSCAITLSVTTAPIAASGGAFAVNVYTGAGCGWIATTPLAWVTVWTASGSGSGTVPFEVKANTSSASRTGTITIGGRTLTVTQDGAPAPAGTAASGVAAKRTPAVSWATPPAIAQGTPLGSAQLNAIASVPGAFTYTPAAGTVLAAGTQKLAATFVPADTTLYTTATANATITVIAVTYQLTVARPTGGTVTGAGINCGTTTQSCTITMPGPTTIGLQATAAAGYTFSGWTGDCSGSSLSYQLQLNGTKSCGASFAAIPAPPPPAASTGVTGGTAAGSPATGDSSALPIGAPYTLTIQRPSGGAVKAAGIYCGTTGTSCTATMPGPMTVTLQAAADSGYVFLAWTGHCSGSNASFQLALEGPRTCGASFIRAASAVIQPAPSTAASAPATTSGISAAGALPMGAPYTLTVTRPTGGRINAAGIDCGTNSWQCSVTMPGALLLALKATPDTGYAFAGWTGNCLGNEPSYSLNLAGPRTCSATFAKR